ncbi:hypothetical protein BgiMline_028975, partial [Biomphalaria glabrata]
MLFALGCHLEPLFPGTKLLEEPQSTPSTSGAYRFTVSVPIFDEEKLKDEVEQRC